MGAIKKLILCFFNCRHLNLELQITTGILIRLITLIIRTVKQVTGLKVLVGFTGTEAFPISVTWNTMFYGLDKKSDDSTKTGLFNIY